jgi:hypothetical protein
MGKITNQEPKETSMPEPKDNDISGVSETSGSVINREEDQQAFARRPVGLTITVERIDHVLAGVQAQIETLRRERTNLGLVRAELAGMETKWREDRTASPR